MGDMIWAFVFALFLLAPGLFGEQFAHVKLAYDKEMARLKEKDKTRKARSSK